MMLAIWPHAGYYQRDAASIAEFRVVNFQAETMKPFHASRRKPLTAKNAKKIRKGR